MERTPEHIRKALAILNTPSDMLVLLAVMGGHNYATKIVKEFKVKQPVITRQLLRLKDVGILNPERNGKAVRYLIDWDCFMSVFYSALNDELKGYINNYTNLSIDNQDLKKIKAEALPREFVEDFFMGYFDTIITLADFKAERRRLEDIIDVLFISLNWSQESRGKVEWKRLTKKYHFNEQLYGLMAFMEQVIAGAAIVNIQSLPWVDIRLHVKEEAEK